jgi:hypothetical protein
VTLRGAFTADLPLKFTSLGLSILLWFLAASEEPATTRVPVEITIRPPAGRRVVHTGGPVHAVVSGSRRELLKLSTSPMHLTRALPDTTAADQVDLELGPGDVDLPRGVDVHVQDLEPRTLAVDLDSTYQRMVPVRAVVRLRTGAGHLLRAIAVVPATVRLLGPRDAIRRIDSVLTQPLEVTRAETSVEETVGLDTSGFGRVRALPAAVDVRVEVEDVGERTLMAVPLRMPSDLAAVVRPTRTTVDVRVRGAATRLGLLDRDSVPVMVEWSGPPGPGHARLRVVAPGGLEAVAVPDTIALVPRGTNG